MAMRDMMDAMRMVNRGLADKYCSWSQAKMWGGESGRVGGLDDRIVI